MAENSKINWTTHTFNPWIGCTKVSPGCLHCYAETLMDTRYGRVKWGARQARSRTAPSNWKKVISWNNKAARDGMRPRVFCASLADWLDDEIPIDWLVDLLDLIRMTPNLDWLLLTKRPQNWERRLRAVAVYLQTSCGGKHTDHPVWQFVNSWLPWNGVHRYPPPENVWFGFTAEDGQWFDKRWADAKNIPARVVFASNEPSLGRLVLPTDFLARGRSAWVINGGESGPGARPMNEAHSAETLAQCRQAGVAFWMKQLGGTTNSRHELSDMPESLRVRELPTPVCCQPT